MSERPEVLQVVMSMIQKYVPERLHHVPISESTELNNDLGINSASVVEMILGLEEILMLKPGEVYVFKTVGDLVDYVVLQRNVTP